LSASYRVAKIQVLQSKSIYLVLAFPQADLDVPVYMELPAGVSPVDVSDIDCGRNSQAQQKSLWTQASRIQLVQKLGEGLIDRDSIQS
jgi:hypothetical protein